MIHEAFITLSTLYIFFSIQLGANAQTPAATQLTPVGATVHQSTCPSLSALPLLSSTQKETWLVGRATRTLGQSDSSQNSCHLFNFGPDCGALQFTTVIGQDGKTRDVTMHAYNVRTNTVAYLEGKFIPTDNSYEIYREQAMETKLFSTQEGASIMATNPSPSTALSQGIEFAKIAQSRDGYWAMLRSCDQLLSWVVFRADLIASDPQKNAVDYYRKSIDDTLKQFNINTSNMAEVSLTFPFAVHEIPHSENSQPPAPSVPQGNGPVTLQTQPASPSPQTTFVYVSAPNSPSLEAQPNPSVQQSPLPSYTAPVQYNPAFSQPIVTYAPNSAPVVQPSSQLQPPPAMSYTSPVTQTPSSPSTLSPTVIYGPPSPPSIPVSPATVSYTPPTAQLSANPNVSPTVISGPPPSPAQIPSSVPVTPSVVSYTPSAVQLSANPSVSPATVVYGPPPPPAQIPSSHLQYVPSVSPPPPVYSYSPAISPPSPPAVVYAPPPALVPPTQVQSPSTIIYAPGAPAQTLSPPTALYAPPPTAQLQANPPVSPPPAVYSYTPVVSSQTPASVVPYVSPP